MLQEMLVRETTQNQAGVTVPLDVALWLINRLKGAGMLKDDFTPPGQWILWSEVPKTDLVSVVQKHLSRLGWRRMVEAMHRHNRQTRGPLWDLAKADDFLEAMELALMGWEATHSDESSGTDKWAPELQRQIKVLEGMVVRRGVTLARRQLDLAGKRAAAQVDGQLLPGLLEGQRKVHPLRESLFREQMRHRLALLVGGALGAIGGGLWSIVESVSEVLIAGVARYAVVVAPALLVGLMTLVAQTLVYSGPFTLGLVGEFMTRALWNGSLTLGAAIIVYGCWLHYVSQHQRRSL